MAKDWRCLIGLHDWREVEMPDRDKCAECTRCGSAIGAASSPGRRASGVGATPRRALAASSRSGWRPA
jgi:hypothetical protein